VILDLDMPKLNGIDTCKKILQRFPCCPIIIISGNTTPEAQHDAHAAGAVAFINKPFSIKALTDTVTHFLTETI